MKRTLMLSLGALLIISSTALAAPGDQDKSERPRRLAISGSGYLGGDLGEVTREVAGRLRLREERGALITGVLNDTAAARAGLQKDDVIVKWNGEPIESVRELERRIRETPAGRNVRLGVLRQGSEMEMAATLGEMHINMVMPRMAVRAATETRVRTAVRAATETRVRLRDGYHLGISLQSMSPQLAEYFGLQNRNGALVTFVHPDSAAARAGIKAGDVILSIGSETIENPRRVVEVLRGRGEGAVEVKVMRDRQERRLTVQLEKGQTSRVWPDDDMEVVVSEALVEPFEIAPLHIQRLPFAPMTLPQIHLAPLAPMAIPRIQIVPMAIPRIHIAPMALPRMTIPRINIPKLVMPPMRIVMPDMNFRIQV